MVFLSFLVIGVFVFIIAIIYNTGANQTAQYDENSKFRQMAKGLREKYGECTLAIRPREYHFNNTDNVLVYDEKKVIAINGVVYDYSTILDFNINNDVSYKTSTSTGSMVGRGLVGGVLFGGVGALAGATTANKESVQNTSVYRINIFLRSMGCPVTTYTTTELINAQKMTAALKNIIDYNENLEK